MTQWSRDGYKMMDLSKTQGETTYHEYVVWEMPQQIHQYWWQRYKLRKYFHIHIITKSLNRLKAPQKKITYNRFKIIPFWLNVDFKINKCPQFITTLYLLLIWTFEG